MPASLRIFPLLASAVLALAAGLAGCRSPAEDLQRRAPVLATEFQQEVKRIQALPDEDLDWPRARALLLAHNLELRQARDAVTSAEERLRQIWRDLRPGASLTANLSKGLTQLGDLNSDDAAFSIYAFLNVPGLIQLRVRHYSATLELIRARWAVELKERELVIRLRDAFLRAELLRQRRKNLALASLWQDNNLTRAGSFDAEPKSLLRESTLWSFRREEDAQQTALAELLGDSSRRWQLVSADLPELPYQATAPEIADTARYGLLYRQLEAVELEGARLRELGVRLLYWPDLSVNLSSPPLVSVQGGTSSRWSFDQIFVNAATTLNLDVRGSVAMQLRETKRDIALLTDLLREKNTQTIQRLLLAREALQLNARQLRLTEFRLDALRGLPRSLEPATVQANLERLLTLDEQRTSLLLERAQLEALFWLIDETQWSRPAWPEPASPSPPPST